MLKVTSLYHIIGEFNGEQEKESSRKENLSLGITVCHHLASLVMPNGDPCDGLFYPTLTLVIDSYSLCS